MLGLIGIKKNVDVNLRERLALSPKKQDIVLKNLMNIFEEAVILSTCNRTEIYFSGDATIEEVFQVVGWDKELIENTFFVTEQKVVKHLFELACGFHSKIIGEDQILGQVRDAYEKAIENETVKSELLRLFEDAISCGKKFRNDTKLYEIPVSASSISINKMISHNVKKLMIMGYGVMGELLVKYALGSNIEEINIVVRHKEKVPDLNDERVNVLDYSEARIVMNEMDGIVSATAATHLIIEENHINKEGKNIVLIDLAMPRDIDYNLKTYNRVQLYDIDDIGKLDDENKHLRVEKMQNHKYIIEEYINEYINWIKVRGISKVIKEIKVHEKSVVDDRITSFKNKSKSDEDIDLAKMLIKSTSNYYVNRAIKVLKAERVKGSEEECLKILSKIFLEN